MENKEFDFEFCISGISAKQADIILTIIVQIVEALGGQLGGGMKPHDEE